MYIVRNLCGGILFQGKSLDRAAKATMDHFAEPYIERNGIRRAVVWQDDEENPFYDLGDSGESYDEAKDRIESLERG